MIKRILFLLWLSTSFFASCYSQSFNIMSYNIRLDTPADGPDRWTLRKAEVSDLIKNYHPAFLGIQEGLPNQVIYLDSILHNYAFAGVGRDDGKQKGEFSALFYDTTRFKMVRSSTFWLSPTPDTVSRGWDAALNRICTWGCFEAKDNKCSVFVFNTHFDHLGVEARKESAALILRKIKEITAGRSIPVILTGDLNATPEQAPVRILSKGMKEAGSVSPTGIKGPEGTFTGFQTTDPPDRRIDYIFVRNIRVLSYMHVNDLRANGRRISDHLPVVATVTCSKKKIINK